MSRLKTLKIIGASASLLCALSLSLTTLAGAAPQRAVMVPKVASSHQHVSPPHAGVKLLEDILSRMRNLPQIAMTRNNQTFQYQQNQAAPGPSSGPTDQLLAIRPKESSLKTKARDARKQAPVVAWGTNNGASYGGSSGDHFYDNARRSNAIAKDDRSDYKGGLGLPESSMGKRVAKPEYVRDFNQNTTSTPVRGTLLSQSSSSQVSGSMLAANRGYADLDQATKEITNRLSPESRQRLQASTGNLFNLAKKLEEVQQAAPVSAGKPAGGGGGGSGGASNTRNAYVADEKHSQSGAFRNEKRLKVISTNPLITEYSKNQASQSSSGSQFAQSADAEEGEFKPAEKAADKPVSIAHGLVPPPPAPAAAPMSPPFATEPGAAMSMQKPPAEPSLFKHVREFLNRDGVASSTVGGADKSKSIEIALLPPSVVTGIPLVRLGTSENETNKALSGKGALNKTMVNDWSVWSLQKPGNDEVSLQIYARNGQVEAIRIFDSSLISPDFGVKLGDELGTVKHKFGEPAFILSEPQSRGGQNYVYPISQVSFQLAYTSKATAPKVVSLLIFNAK